MPRFHERPVRAEERIGRWQGYFGDLLSRASHVVMGLSARISAYDLEAVVAAHAPVADAGRKDDHIPGLQPQQRSRLPADPQRDFSFGDAVPCQKPSTADSRGGRNNYLKT